MQEMERKKPILLSWFYPYSLSIKMSSPYKSSLDPLQNWKELQVLCPLYFRCLLQRSLPSIVNNVVQNYMTTYI